jgi:hypothetical protein
MYKSFINSQVLTKPCRGAAESVLEGCMGEAFPHRPHASIAYVSVKSFAYE